MINGKEFITVLVDSWSDRDECLWELQAGGGGKTMTDHETRIPYGNPKAMPVILSMPEEIETWVTAPVDEALKIQRPLQNGALKIVATGQKEDLHRNRTHTSRWGFSTRT
jgi:hypothetical protein